MEPRKRRTFSLKAIEAAIGLPIDKWYQQCHATSLAIVKSGLVGESRVARGCCKGVPGQHSWVVLGRDCYDRHATILDPTLWSYDTTVEGIWKGKNLRRHFPFGHGCIFDASRPCSAGGEVIELTPKAPLSAFARGFLSMTFPGGLDFEAWRLLAKCPVIGWPAGEIIAAMHNTPKLAALVPIDILGMTTDLNPGGLYF